MPTITAVEPQRRKGRFNIYVDGNFVIGVGEAVIVRLGLRTGTNAASEELARIAREEELQNAVAAAVRLLESRPRAVREIKDRLYTKGFEQDIVDETINKLTTLGYLNDAQFAQSWVESRSRSRPGGIRKRRSELIAKGIARDDIDSAVAPISEDDEIAMARQAATKILPSPSTNSAERRKQFIRLTSALQRRGFGWSVIKEVLKTLGESEIDEGTDDND
ncbi:MAG: RecX family transcriptional regulator [Capsulimonadaceae bacterium]|nr:RecX family transcriptional regulator [Capsulimonadaceae bacterium]